MDGLKEIGRERRNEAEMDDFNEWMNEWMDERENEQTNELINESMPHCLFSGQN